MASYLAEPPNKLTTIMAFVLGVISPSTSSGLILKVSLSISTKTGKALLARTEDGVAHIVVGEVITSSPGPMPKAPTAACKAAVAELKLTAYFTLK